MNFIRTLTLIILTLAFSFSSLAQTGTPNLILAEKARDVEDWDTAITYFTKSIEADETKGNVFLSAIVYAHRCQAYFNKNKNELAIADCDKAIEIKADMAYVYHLRASLFSRVNKYDRAIADYTHAIQLEPNSADHYFSRGLTYSQTGNRDQAIADLGKAIELDPSDADAYLMRAQTLRQKGDYDAALFDYQAAIRLDPSMVEGHVGLGLSYRHKRDYDRAVASFNKALQIDPRSKDALLFRGVVFADQGDLDRAIRDYTEALRIDPKFISPYPIRGDAYVKKGNYRAAIADYTKRLEMDPSAATLYARAWANLYANDGNAAFNDAESFLASGEIKDQRAYAILVGYFGLRKAGKAVEAKSFLTRSIKLVEPDSWPAKIMRHLLAEMTAEQLMELATDNDKQTEAHAYIGMMKLLAGDTAGARTEFEWVRTKGNQSFSEYTMAVAELSRMPQKVGP